MLHLFLTAAVLAASPPSSGAAGETIRLYVRPMPAPRSILKYQLLPDLGELTPGNAAQGWLKCFMEQRSFFYSQEGVSQRERYRKMPLLELRLDQVAGQYSTPRQVDWAARMDTVDWQALQGVQDGGLDALPPEAGPLQILAESLQARYRVQVAANRFDDAIRTAQTMLALARHLGEHPSGLADLVGLGAAHLALDTLAEMVQQPGCPNLYWALTDLPCPLVDLRKGIQGDRVRVAAALRPLRGDATMTDAEIDAFVGRISGVLAFAREQAGLPPRGLRAALKARASDRERVAAARRRLVEAGSSRELVEKWPPLQVILLDDRLDYEVRRDERIGRMARPTWEPDPPADAREGDGVFADLLPRIDRLRESRAKLEQQVALLRHVEAIRLHAAGHGGAPPRTLAEVAVPLPVDPFTGKPFIYAVEGSTAHLRGGPPPGRDLGGDVHYEVTLLK